LQLKAGVVGLAGLEPAASSLSGIEGSALCGPAFSQITAEPQGPRMRSYKSLLTGQECVAMAAAT
jgi:hypothetical protein